MLAGRSTYSSNARCFGLTATFFTLVTKIEREVQQWFLFWDILMGRGVFFV